MLINRMIRLRRPITAIVILPLLFTMCGLPSYGRADEPQVKVQNIAWMVRDDAALITYDLIGSAGETYDVGIVLKNELERSLLIVPRSLSGDVGEGRSAGVGKSIRWEFRKDFPGGLPGEGYYFELTVEPASGGFPWLLVGLGVAVAGGGAALLFRSRNESTPVTEPLLPLPPPRPGN